jgi:hypothetical protein
MNDPKPCGTVRVSASEGAVFKTVASAVEANPKEIIVDDGEYTVDNPPTFNGIPATIRGGTFNTSVCGGRHLKNDGGASAKQILRKLTHTCTKTIIGSADRPQNSTLVISGGTFNRIVFAGERIDSDSPVIRYGDISMLITGGLFLNAVAAGGAHTYQGDCPEKYTIVGNVSLTITGGVFMDVNRKGCIYGGCLGIPSELAEYTTIRGNVTVRIDTSAKPFLSNIVLGSYGQGKISGDAELIIAGNSDLNVSGIIFGSSYSDTIHCNPGFVKPRTSIRGRRILTFSDFHGAVKCQAIQAFSEVAFKDGSEVVIKNRPLAEMDKVEKWTFEFRCKVEADFENDFSGKTLNLVGHPAGDHTILSSTEAKTFTGFGKLKTIQLNGNEVLAEYDDEKKAYRLTNEAMLALVEDADTGIMDIVYSKGEK